MSNELATSKDTTIYLKHVYELEKALYEQKRIMDYLENSIRTINHQMQLEPKLYREEKNSIVGNIITSVVCTFLAILTVRGYLFLKSPAGGAPNWFLYLMLGGIGILICFAIGEIIMAIVNVNRTNSYNKNVRETNNNNMEENQRWRQSLQERKEALSNEYSILKEERRKTKAVLEKFYSTNVIFPKYRTLPAISSLFEYMLSGRCYELTGHEGAYNLYENELRLGHIISTLDSISSDLNEIKQNQRMLCDAVSESINVTERLLEQQVINGKILYDIRQSSQIIQYNQAQVANRVEHMHWLEEQKYLFG